MLCSVMGRTHLRIVLKDIDTLAAITSRAPPTVRNEKESFVSDTKRMIAKLTSYPTTFLVRELPNRRAEQQKVLTVLS